MIEIERKFLVTNNQFLEESKSNNRIVQGYLSSVAERTVRVRIKDEKGYITVKGASSTTGASRLEWEKEIYLNEAELLLPLCEKGIIEKIRYEVPFGKHLFEVDVFLGLNQGLVLAEIELQTENEFFDRPSWLGLEVTSDMRFYNAYLSRHPYSEWDIKI
ncbi:MULTISPECIES: CYTH domain-containing protein [Flavobacterium]|uniref:CYTH domain-containing protein n=2 Tax=Flavobacterium TaxID=237 RepID=A0AA94F3J0_9FLAO|nr:MULTISPECIES: CYTH domain-containing protein [Flavobacterium]OXA77811.1 adenylate cyclase [Flavobacterium columnare] [Flavobacterium columnare NBRC 100251 = ATCC 23463]AMA48187.1 adenylate cyclase [Flavobacterium covae]AND63676.1 adenylate cyclase [Flavobacterium covae]MCH4830100.1 CYTH domain-containing protein [Flavobacterium columnare]MCH4832520.1 CYTH domain-containing protein [Flavobacterium columnare]